MTLAVGLGRRGARRPELVPLEVRRSLEAGGVSANHMEQIAMDRATLWSQAFPDLERDAHQLEELKLVTSLRIGGRLLYDRLGEQAWGRAGRSGSDTVRGWGAMAVAAAPLPIAERLALLRPFANDPHFAVREWAWLAFRPDVVADPAAAIDALGEWTADPSARVRRMASEATRPRGVWSPHVPELKAQPELAVALLDSLRADPARYVQDSVGNWLNDVATTRPDWVRSTLRRWADTGPSTGPAARIARRATRKLR